MQRLNRDQTESSVAFSLAELERLEEERLREEERQRAEAVEARQREQRSLERARQRAEEARVKAELDAEHARTQQEAEERALREGRAQAAVEVARLEADSKAKLAALNAQRAHELDILRARAKHGARRTTVLLSSALAIVVTVGILSLFAMANEDTRLEEQLQSANAERSAATHLQRLSLQSRFARLNRRFETFEKHASASEARAELEVARQTRDALREALMNAGVQAASVATVASAANQPAGSAAPRLLSEFEQHLDILDEQQERVKRRAALDARMADFEVIVSKPQRTEVSSALRSALVLSKRKPLTPRALDAYEQALNQLRKQLADKRSHPRSRGTSDQQPAHDAVPRVPSCLGDGDPMCGFDGKGL